MIQMGLMAQTSCPKCGADSLFWQEAPKKKQCAQCPNWFEYGYATGRRKSAKYCSIKCRKAAYIERTK